MTRATLVVIALGLAGCLFKPGPPSGTGDAGDDAGDDAPPAPVDCDSEHRVPADFVLDGPPQIYDFNHDGYDDLFVYGTTNDSQPAAYVMFGRDQLDMQCLDVKRAFPLGPQMLDAWVGDVDGDGLSDIALLGPDPNADSYALVFYDGTGLGDSSSTTAYAPAADFTVPNIHAGAHTLLGIPPPASPQIIFGGDGGDAPFGTFPISSGAAVPGRKLLETENPSAVFTWGEPALKVWAPAASPARLLATLSDTVRAANVMAPPVATRIDTTDHVGILGRNDTDVITRPWYRPQSLDTSVAVIARHHTTEILIVSYNDAAGFSTNALSSEDTERIDVALGQLHGPALSPDLIEMSDLGGGAGFRLAVHPEVRFSAPLDPNPRIKKGIAHGRYLAVGNFSHALAGDQILVIDQITSVNGGLGTCYRLDGDAIVACAP